MRPSLWTKIKLSLRDADRWLRDTPDRALEDAYDAALMIKSIEDEYFKGKKIAAESADLGESVIAYFNTELKKYLKVIEVRLIEFNASRTVISLSDIKYSPTTQGNFSETIDHFSETNGYPPVIHAEVKDQPSIILEKLAFIDGVTAKYRPAKSTPNSVAIVPATNGKKAVVPINTNPQSLKQYEDELLLAAQNNSLDEIDNNGDDTRFLPRSLLGTLNRIKNELDPEAEQEVVKKFRRSKVKTIISIRFLLLLILIPLLTQQLSKNFLVGPIVDSAVPEAKAAIFLNLDMKKEAFTELQRYEEELKFDALIGMAPPLTSEAKEEKIKEKAAELAEEFRGMGYSAIKNIFSDMLAVVAFIVLLLTNKKEVDVLKSFLDDILYGLSDSAKAFIIILLTDMFVGFHSPHGWEVILEGLARHFGMPENREFIFLFIATFPVILDAVFKYWIFRYLNRSSPSAVATYKNMNE